MARSGQIYTPRPFLRPFAYCSSECSELTALTDANSTNLARVHSTIVPIVDAQSVLSVVFELTFIPLTIRPFIDASTIPVGRHGVRAASHDGQ